MTLTTPWMFVAGCAVIGFILPELLSIFNRRVPLGLNLLGAVAGGLLAGAFV